MTERPWRPSDAVPLQAEGGVIVEAPELEDSTYLDTMGLQLDRTLQLIHGTQAWFDEHPEYESLHFAPPVPIEDVRNAEAYEIEITREWLQAFKKVALTRYCDLREHSELGHDLARDVVASWKEPEDFNE